MSGESWHIVEAKRDDGEAAIFRIRELAPRKDLTTIFVVEMPYATAEMSKLPGVAAYRRLAKFEEDWIAKASARLGWVFVGVRIEDGSFFLYLYGAGDPGEMIAALAPFDGALGFYDDRDPKWDEYKTMRELLDQAKTLPKPDAARATASSAQVTAESPSTRKRRRSPTAAHPVLKPTQAAPETTMRMQAVHDVPASASASAATATLRKVTKAAPPVAKAKPKAKPAAAAAAAKKPAKPAKPAKRK